MLDDATQDLLARYSECERFIDEGREKGTVLIHWYVVIANTIDHILLDYVVYMTYIW